MCDPATVAIVSAVSGLATAGAAVYGAANAPKPPKPVKPPAPVQPAPVTRKREDQAGGYADTLLTGPRGLAAGSQNIGSNSLLGN